MKLFFNGELIEASPLKDIVGGPITAYQIGRDFIGAADPRIVVPSADVQSGKVPPTPFSETGDDLEKLQTNRKTKT